MLNYMGFSCWISSGDEQLQTHSEESLGSVRSAWIASEPGKSFAVHWQDKSGKRIATSGHVFIDGKDVASAIIRPGRDTPVKRTGAKIGRNTIKPFVFSELSLTDDDTLANQYDASLRDVGVIKVEITRVRLGAEVPFAGYEAKDHGVVHERAKKAGAHCTKFGEAKRVVKGRTVGISTAPYDPNEPGPYVTFEFRYRSLEMLKATGIVQVSRKRSNESPNNDDVIEIESSEDEDSSVTLHSSPRTTSPESPSKKRVKTEPQVNDLPLPSFPNSDAPTEVNDEERVAIDGAPPLLTHSQPEEAAQLPDKLSQPTLDSSVDVSDKQPVKEEEEGDEELDMLAGDSEVTTSNEVSQNVDGLEYDLPPPSSSPGPETFTNEETREADS